MLDEGVIDCHLNDIDQPDPLRCCLLTELRSDHGQPGQVTSSVDRFKVILSRKDEVLRGLGSILRLDFRVIGYRTVRNHINRRVRKTHREGRLASRAHDALPISASSSASSSTPDEDALTCPSPLASASSYSSPSPSSVDHAGASSLGS